MMTGANELATAEVLETVPFTRNTAPPLMRIARGELEVVYDDTGRRYLDFSSQSLNTSLGQCHPAVNDALLRAVERYTYVSSRFGCEPYESLARAVTDLTPDLTKVNLKVASSTMANEGALKIAYKHRGMRGVVSLLGSHLGQSVETMRISGKHFEKAYLDRAGVFFAEPCTCYGDLDPRTRLNVGPDAFDQKCACAVRMCELILKHKDEIAAVVMEPLMMDAGVVVQTKGYLAAVRDVTSEEGLVLIFDEAQTAFGWTGHMFLSSWFSVVPDVLTFGKSLAAGLPLGGFLMSERFDLLDYGEHEITHGAHPHSCAVALANLGLLCETGLLASVSSTGTRLREGLVDVMERHPGAIRDVRGVGHIVGVEIAEGPDGAIAEQIVKECMKRGLILRMSRVGERHNVIQVKPPLVASSKSIDEALDIFEQSVASLTRVL